MADVCSAGVDTGFVALGYSKIATLGVVQGISELLPISSTAHMRIVPAAFGWQDPGSAFSAVMQLAALVAVVSYFWRDIRNIVFGSVTAIRTGDYYSPWLRLAIGIVLATLPIAIVGFAMSQSLNACGTWLRSIEVMGFSCIVMAVLMAGAEITCSHYRNTEGMGLRDALIVGLAQVGALIPGVSRSGSTLTAALFLGFRREEAARFSFLIGMPAIFLAGMKELWVLYNAELSQEAWMMLGWGLLIGSISAFVAVWGLMRFLEKFSTWPFIIYRGLLGLVLLGAAFGGFIS
ncbi:undecaprenyl-diphosphate phosphatase [Microvirga sp. W0021]|uniref:Undecaprenyl-diphosphatase n=1 Tax=Hohaiivirga grylli TaxID=3133970 RepID=A0ABV0BJN3_9HYPH